MWSIRKSLALALVIASTLSANATARCLGSVNLTMERLLNAAQLGARLSSINIDARPAAPYDYASVILGQVICLQQMNTKRADYALVELLDYNIGDGHIGFLMLKIAERGKVVIPALIAHKGTAPKCRQKFTDICEVDAQMRRQRDESIESILRNIPKRRGESWRN